MRRAVDALFTYLEAGAEYVEDVRRADAERLSQFEH